MRLKGIKRKVAAIGLLGMTAVPSVWAALPTPVAPSTAPAAGDWIAATLALPQPVDREVAATAAPMFKKLSLELGGKNPLIVFADADLDLDVALNLDGGGSTMLYLGAGEVERTFPAFDDVPVVIAVYPR